MEDIKLDIEKIENSIKSASLESDDLTFNVNNINKIFSMDIDLIKELEEFNSKVLKNRK